MRRASFPLTPGCSISGGFRGVGTAPNTYSEVAQVSLQHDEGRYTMVIAMSRHNCPVAFMLDQKTEEGDGSPGEVWQECYDAGWPAVARMSRARKLEITDAERRSIKTAFDKADREMYSRIQLLENPPECSWCGADLLVDRQLTPNGSFYKSRSGEFFCCRAHQQASAQAVRELRGHYEKHDTEITT